MSSMILELACKLLLRCRNLDFWPCTLPMSLCLKDPRIRLVTLVSVYGTHMDFTSWPGSLWIWCYGLCCPFSHSAENVLLILPGVYCNNFPSFLPWLICFPSYTFTILFSLPGLTPVHRSSNHYKVRCYWIWASLNAYWLLHSA